MVSEISNGSGTKLNGKEFQTFLKENCVEILEFFNNIQKECNPEEEDDENNN